MIITGEDHVNSSVILLSRANLREFSMNLASVV